MISLAFCCRVEPARAPAFNLANKCKSVSVYIRSCQITRIPVANHNIDWVSSSVLHLQCSFSRYTHFFLFLQSFILWLFKSIRLSFGAIVFDTIQFSLEKWNANEKFSDEFLKSIRICITNRNGMGTVWERACACRSKIKRHQRK